MKSIRRTLGLWFSVSGLLLLLVAAAALWVGVRRLLTEQFDVALRAKLKTFTTLIEQEGDYVELGFIEEAMPEFSAAAEPEYLQLWLADRDDDWVLYRSPSLAGGNLPRLGGSELEPAIDALVLPDGRHGRAIGAEFSIQNYDPGPEQRARVRVAFVLARGAGALEHALLAFGIGTLVVVLLVVGTGFLLGSRALRRGLRPLEEFAQHVGGVVHPTRTRAFGPPGVPQELVPLVRSHNEMLERIKKAFERERRTAANIAHELRTPVSELVLLAESAGRLRSDAVESARIAEELREIGAQMSGLIATLLELARMESGQVPLEIEAIDLAQMVRDCGSPLTSAAQERGQTLELPRGQGPIVRADRVALSILLANLLRNAVDHAPVGDRIRCEVTGEGQQGLLVLANTTERLQPCDLDKLTEPFWRASRAREDRTHAGIGLSLARRFAELLEVELGFELEERVFRARLRFQLDTASLVPAGRRKPGPNEPAPRPAVRQA